MEENKVYGEGELKRDPSKGKEVETTSEENKENVSKSQVEEGTKTLIGNNKMVANKKKEIDE